MNMRNNLSNRENFIVLQHYENLFCRRKSSLVIVGTIGGELNDLNLTHRTPYNSELVSEEGRQGGTL